MVIGDGMVMKFGNEQVCVERLTVRTEEVVVMLSGIAESRSG